MRVIRKLALLLTLPVLAACPLSTTDDDPEPSSPDALVGVWQGTIPGEVQLTIRFGGDGILQVVDAFLDEERCVTQNGYWTAADGVITYGITEENGQPSTETGTVPYAISGNTLTINAATPDEEVLSRFGGPMPVCGDYGWPSLVAFEAILGGVSLDFTRPGPNPVEATGMSIGAIAEAGNIELRGRIGGSAYPCPDCEELQIVLNGTGPTAEIVPGTYVRVGTAGPGDAGDALVVYSGTVIPTPDPSQVFWSDGSDASGNEQGSVTVIVTVVEESRIAGSFDVVLWNGDGTASRSGTGEFDIRYD